MSLERYLLAAAQALRDDVLPELQPSAARDQVINCLRVLTRVAIALERGEHGTAELFADADIPAELRAAFAPVEGERPAPRLADDIVVDKSSVDGISAASRWLSDAPWCGDAAQGAIARRLLGWERRQRIARLARLRAAEEPSAGGPRTAVFSGAKLSETVLRDYLRDRMRNPHLAIEDYRVLPGGRTRKTVTFRQSGQPDWPERLVVQCDPPVGYHIFPGVVSQFPVLDYIHRSGGVNAPRPVLLERDPEPFGSPFMIVSQLPGKPPNPALDFFAPPPKSEAMALSLARQMGVVHGLSVAPLPKDVPVMLPGEAGWAGDLEQLGERVASEFHGPSLCVSASLAWMRANLGHVVDRVSIVHGDVLQHNILVEGEEVSAILDWEGVRVGHPGEDLGYMRPMIEQMVSWDRFMEVYRANGGPALGQAEVDFFTLRAYVAMLTHVAHSRNEFEAGRVDDVRTAEVACSLGPLFVRCLSDMLDAILHSSASASAVNRGSRR